MRRFFHILLLTLVLMTVSLISALMAMQFAIHGREVPIPSLIGRSPAEAERAASTEGLQLVVERQFYSAEVPEGKIMTQLPPAGTKVRRGWTVRAAQSLGPQRVTIPDLTRRKRACCGTEHTQTWSCFGQYRVGELVRCATG